MFVHVGGPEPKKAKLKGVPAAASGSSQVPKNEDTSRVGLTSQVDSKHNIILLSLYIITNMQRFQLLILSQGSHSNALMC